MDCRIFYILVSIVMVKHTEACIEERRNCTSALTCSNRVDFDWVSLRQGYTNVPDYCQPVITYNRHRIYPIELTYSQKPNREPIPHVSYDDYYGDQNDAKDFIYSINLSNLGYSQTPKLKSMQNLAKLNISRNNLNTAELSNSNDLNLLTEIDLSYNTISVINVNTYSNLYHKLQIINISHNRLGEIPVDVFDKFKYLQTLDLSYNYIDRLTQVTFDGVRNLTELNLSNNRLRSINSSLFRFTKLQTLDISNNEIDNLKLSDIGNLGNLQTLDVSYNMIKTIEVNAFNSLYLLENLNINNNLLELVDKTMFASLQSLKHINLSYNKIKSLPIGMFHNSTILGFSITNNSLEGSLVKGIFDGINVTQLDLSHQYLTEIQDQAFYNLVNLEELFLNSNRITSLSHFCFQALVNLQHLDLSVNQITNITFDTGDLSNLKSLLLKNNHIANIEFEQMQHLTNLEKLDISGNKISHFKPNSFLMFSNLLKIKIYDNPLIGILEQDTFNGLSSTISLDFSHNMLTTIQNASFNNMNELKELNMSRCSISELQYNVFTHTGQIETLDLSYNKLIDFSINGTELHKLSSLLLNNNLIKTISPNSLKGIRLNTLTISHNEIQNMHNEVFNALAFLPHLDLSYNEKLNFNMSMLKNVTTLILSGVKTSLNFSCVLEDSPITDLVISNASIQNVTTLNLGKLSSLASLDLSYNNIRKLQIGSFTKIKKLKYLDLSYNKISSIQPGVFKDNTILHSLNVSHNSLSSISYGIFRGLNNLKILNMSYNNIKDLQSERFFEIKTISQLIVDFNKIDSLNEGQFTATSLSILSIGDNPLPCQILARLSLSRLPYKITAIKIDEHNNENVNGVACNKGLSEQIPVFHNVGDNYTAINELNKILYNITYRNIDQDRSSLEYLEKILSNLEKSNDIYDQKLSDANIILNNISKLLGHIADVKFATTPVPITHPTSNVPLTDKDTDNGKIIACTSYINQIKKELSNTIAIEKKNFINDIERKLKDDRSELLPNKIDYEKLTTNFNVRSKNLFTETYISLVLSVIAMLILVGFVLYKLYLSRMFKNRPSLSTRELPGDSDISML